MPRTTETVPITPDVLRWARETIGLSRTQAADALRVSPEEVRSWESGQAQFTISQLRQVARVYRRPVSALLQPIAPPMPALPTDFRTVGGAQPVFSRETLIAIRDAQRIQDVASDLLKEDASLFPKALLPQANLSDDPHEVAALEREHLGMGLATQMGLRNASEAYNRWRAHLQHTGILTLAKQMPREDCRGFSLAGGNLIPTVVANSREVEQAKIFTLLHEYAHLILGIDAVCLENDQVDVERWCNRFSSALLVPAQALIQRASTWVTSVDEVQSLAWLFKVSRHVIALRLAEIDRASQELYEQVKDEDRQRIDWEKPTRSEDDEIRRPQDAIRLSEVGFGFATLVFGALDKGTISATEAMDFLDMRADRLSPLRENANAAAARYG